VFEVASNLHQQLARRVVVHYRLVESLDRPIERSLREGLGEAWAAFDPTEIYGAVLPPGPLERFIADRIDLRAVSSYSARPPLREIPGVATLPLLLLRHPLARVRVLYDAAVRNGSNATFAEFVDKDLNSPIPTAGNGQTTFLGGTSDDAGYARALAFLGSCPTVGVVERPADSLRAFETALGPIVPEVRWSDVTDVDAGELPDLAELCESLGADRYARLVASNQYDLMLHRSAMRRLAPAVAAR